MENPSFAIAASIFYIADTCCACENTSCALEYTCGTIAATICTMENTSFAGEVEKKESEYL